MQQPLKKNVFSLINILGLSTGLAACLLITVYVQEETHYDRFAARAKDIYRVDLSVTGNVAAPFAWWGMSQWLREFAYRVPISWWIFPLAGAAALAVAVLTISFQAARAAIANPVDSLRSE